MTLRVILHLDLDAFFASVEQRDRPELRGKPVIVGADPHAGRGRGVVVAASYEARAHGVRSAMPVSEAWRRAPHATWIRPRHERYAEASDAVFAILRATGAPVEPASIDEAYLDLTNRVADQDEGAAYASALKRRIRHEQGLTASVGIAGSKLVAKIASDHGKPDGLTLVRDPEAATFLAPLPARRIPGVGPKTADALAHAGIRTCAELAEAPLGLLGGIVGTFAPRLKQMARGLDDTPVETSWERRSLGTETTFPEDATDRDAILAALDDLATEAADHLAAERLLARTIALKIRTSDFTTFTRARTLPGPVGSPEALREVARRLFLANDPGEPIRLVGLRLSGLASGGQATLDAWMV